MSVSVLLDKPHNCFTNLDFISGRVILQIPYNETISAIVVKLEGESKTRLVSYVDQFGRPSGREHTQLEVHKLLYKVQTVFPSTELQQVASKNPSYTLQAGRYEYPFKFKIPFNNDCSKNSMFTNLNVVGLRMELAQDTNRHVKKTLPPSLKGIPGQMEIAYYVKVTVQRPAFYKGNFRQRTDFKFMPIEPPRPPRNKRETYARRQHQFAPSVDGPSKSSLFRRDSTKSQASQQSVLPPKVCVDGRLPDPPIITCNEPLPLRILITKLNDSPATIYVDLLQVALVANTTCRAHELSRSDPNSWVIMSTANMHLPLNPVDGENGKEMEIDAGLWNLFPLPSNVAPSFSTCNISRNYFIDISVGLQYGSGGNISPELTVQTLRMPVEVYSGIAPPEALLVAMADRPPIKRVPVPMVRPSFPQPSSSSQSPSAPRPSSGQFAPPPSDIPDEAPPSYEDAIADDLAPVDGPRRDYHHEQPAGPAGTNEKAAGNDRLFPDSGS